MESIKVLYDETDKLKSLIDEVYFSGDNMGKKSNSDNSLKIESSVMKVVLSDMGDYVIKLTNGIIDGSMKFETSEVDGEIYLIPTSTYCIKKDEDKDLYSFY